MIHLILMLLGLTFSNDNANTAVNKQSSTANPSESDEDTGGEDGIILPPKK